MSSGKVLGIYSHWRRCDMVWEALSKRRDLDINIGLWAWAYGVDPLIVGSYRNCIKAIREHGVRP